MAGANVAFLSPTSSSFSTSRGRAAVALSFNFFVTGASRFLLACAMSSAFCSSTVVASASYCAPLVDPPAPIARCALYCRSVRCSGVAANMLC